MEASIINIEDIISVEEIPMEDVYDLSVEGNSNYYLATQCLPILVHNSGKSVFIRWYLSEFVRHNHDEMLKWALYTPENRPVSREYAKLSEVMTGKSFARNFYNSMTEDVRMRSMAFISKHFFIVSPDRNNYENWDNQIQPERINTLESLIKYLAYLKRTENIFGYVIDAWNKIEHEQPKWMTETTFISQQLDYLINFNDTYDLHGIIIVHPRKLEMGSNMNYKMPSLYDIKGSSAWKEKADIGILVHRNKMKKRKRADIPDGADEDEKFDIDEKAPTIIRTEKIRFEEIGKEGRVKLSMDYKKGGRFEVIKEEKKDEPSPDTRIEGKKADEDFKLIGDDDEGDTEGLPF